MRRSRVGGVPPAAQRAGGHPCRDAEVCRRRHVSGRARRLSCWTGRRTPRLCLVTGATGYVGGRLVPELLAAGHRVRVVARTPSKLSGRPWRPDVEVVEGDAQDAEVMRGAMDGVDVAYYLLHSIGTGKDFASTERQTAEVFAETAADAAWHESSTSAGSTPRTRSCRNTWLAVRGRARPARIRRPDDRLPSRRHHRVGVGFVRDAALPDRATAGDGDAALGPQPGPADRDPRRAAVPRGRGRRSPTTSTGRSTSPGPTS